MHVAISATRWWLLLSNSSYCKKYISNLLIYLIWKLFLLCTFSLYKYLSKYSHLHLHVTQGLIHVNNSAKKLHTLLFICNLLSHFPRLNFDFSCQKKNTVGEKWWLDLTCHRCRERSLVWCLLIQEGLNSKTFFA